MRLGGWLTSVRPTLPALTVMLASLLLLSESAGGSVQAVGVRTGVVAFEAANGLYLVDAGSGGPHLIPGSKPGDGDPRIAPDGSTIAFDRDSGGTNRDIWVMNVDGTGQRRLTFSPALDNWPQWAPHGRSLAFLSERDGYRSVYVANVRTGAARRVVRYGQFPSWTADGRLIFTGLTTKNEAGLIFTIRPYGADRQPLPTQPGHALGVRQSPDGLKIVYSTRSHQVYRAAADGTQAAPLVAPVDDEANDPDWSPDGQWILYDLGPAGTAQATATGKYPSDIWVIRSDGTENQRLTTTGACCADWHGPLQNPEGG